MDYVSDLVGNKPYIARTKPENTKYREEFLCPWVLGDYFNPVSPPPTCPVQYIYFLSETTTLCAFITITTWTVTTDTEDTLSA